MHEIPDAEAIAMTTAKQAVAEFPPLILNLLVNLESRLFPFMPTPGDAAVEWRGFHEFADGYSRLPATIITRFANYLFECRVASSPGS